MTRRPDRRRRAVRPGAWSTALHMLACRARPALTACSEHALSKSNGARAAANGGGFMDFDVQSWTLIKDGSAVHASFLAGFSRAGWMLLAWYSVWSIWRAVCPHGTPRARPKRCTWRQMASFLCFVWRTISLPLYTSLSSSLEHDAHAAACTPPSPLTSSLCFTFGRSVL